jgi:hypothetical protein
MIDAQTTIAPAAYWLLAVGYWLLFPDRTGPDLKVNQRGLFRPKMPPKPCKSVHLRISLLESNMGGHTPSRKPFVIKYGGMAYRGRGDMYQKVNALPTTGYWLLATGYWLH